MSKQTQECISTAHCLMSAPAAGSWDIMLCFTQKQTGRKQMHVTDTALKVFSRGSGSFTKEQMETCGFTKRDVKT